MVIIKSNLKGYFTYKINLLRYNYFVSHIARYISLPIKIICDFISKNILQKVWINGGTVKYDGIKIRFPRNVAVMYATGIYWNRSDGCDKLNWNLLRILLPKASHFIDVGSYVGMYSVFARKINPSLIIDAFEPVPFIYEKNVLFHKENHINLNGNHRVVKAAISDKDGYATLHLPINPCSMREETVGTIRQDSWQAREPYKSKNDINEYKIDFQVETMKLDSYYYKKFQLNGVVVIKIDVEDFEAAVLSGAISVIEEFKPLMLIEVLPSEHGNQETFKILDSLSYSAFAITPTGLYRFTSHDFMTNNRLTIDFFCIHNSFLPSNRNYIPSNLEDIRLLS